MSMHASNWHRKYGFVGAVYYLSLLLGGMYRYYTATHTTTTNITHIRLCMHQIGTACMDLLAFIISRFGWDVHTVTLTATCTHRIHIHTSQHCTYTCSRVTGG